MYLPHDKERTMTRLEQYKTTIPVAARTTEVQTMNADEQRERLYSLIRAAVALGLTHTEAAQLSGLSRQRIGQIVNA